MEKIKLQSSDGEIFHVEKDTLSCSGTLTQMINNSDVTSVIQAPNVNSETLKRILKWAENHRYDHIQPQVLRDDEIIYEQLSIDTWDSQLLDIDQGKVHV